MTDSSPERASRTKILVVEDHALFRDLLRTVLQGTDVDLREVSDGEAALRLNASFRPHWIILDIELPGRDGLSVLREIKGQASPTRVAIVTHHDGADVRAEAMRLGADLFLSKGDVTQLKKLLTTKL